jgi:hypothetical protein
MNEAVAKMMATASGFNDQSMMDVAMSSGVPGMVDLVQKRIDAQAKFAEAHNKIEDAYSKEQAKREFLASPEAKTMSKQDIYDKIKQIDNAYGQAMESPEAIRRRAMLLAAGDVDGAYRGLTYSSGGGATRRAVDELAPTISPEEARGDPYVQAVLGFKEREGSIRRLSTIKANMEFKQVAALGAIDILKQKSDALPRGTFVPYNFVEMLAAGQVSDPKVAAYYASVNTLMNEYTGAINPNNARGTVFDKHHFLDLLNKYAGGESVDATLGVLRQEIRNAAKSLDVIEQSVLDGNKSVIQILDEQEAKGGGAAPGGGGAAPAGGAGWSIEPVH